MLANRYEEAGSRFESRVHDIARAWRQRGIKTSGITGGITPATEKVAGWINGPGSRPRFAEVIRKLGPEWTVEALICEEQFRGLFSPWTLQNAARHLIEVLDEEDAFTLGRTAEVRELERDSVHSWKLVSPNDADMESNQLSVDSPVGRRLLRAKPGEEVEVKTPKRTKVFRIERLI